MVAFPAPDLPALFGDMKTALSNQNSIYKYYIIRLLYEKTDYPVTQVIYLWSGKEWLPWGEAMKKQEVISHLLLKIDHVSRFSLMFLTRRIYKYLSSHCSHIQLATKGSFFSVTIGYVVLLKTALLFFQIENRLPS